MVSVGLLHLHFLVLQLTLSRVGLKTLCWIRGLSSLAPPGCWHHCAKMVHCVCGSLSLSVRPYLASPIRNLSIHQYQLALPLHNPSCQWCPLVTTHPPGHLIWTMLLFDQVIQLRTAQHDHFTHMPAGCGSWPSHMLSLYYFRSDNLLGGICRCEVHAPQGSCVVSAVLVLLTTGVT